MESNSLLKTILTFTIFILVFLVTLLAFIAAFTDWTPGDIFSFGQFALGITLVPLVLFSLYFAIRAFQDAQKQSEIKAQWKNEADQLVTSAGLDFQDSNPHDRTTPEIILVNSGNTIERWYQVQVDIPKAFNASPSPSIKNYLGDKENWGQENLPDATRIKFMSNGSFALYPDMRQNLCSIHADLDEGTQFPKTFRFPTTIYSEKGKMQQSILEITIKG